MAAKEAIAGVLQMVHAVGWAAGPHPGTGQVIGYVWATARLVTDCHVHVMDFCNGVAAGCDGEEGIDILGSRHWSYDADGHMAVVGHCHRTVVARDRYRKMVAVDGHVAGEDICVQDCDIAVHHPREDHDIPDSRYVMVPDSNFVLLPDGAICFGVIHFDAAMYFGAVVPHSSADSAPDPIEIDGVTTAGHDVTQGGFHYCCD